MIRPFAALVSVLCPVAVDESGHVLATQRSGAANRQIVVPIHKDRGYGVRGKIPNDIAAGQTSAFTMRRWLARQEGFYSSGHVLNDMAVVGAYAYALNRSGLEVISLADPEHPVRVAQLPRGAGASALDTFGAHLLVAGEGLSIFSLGEPQKPAQVGRLELGPNAISAVVRRTTGSNASSLAYAFGAELHVVNLSDPEHPFEAGRVNCRVKANRAIERQGLLYAFGRGVEIYDLSKSERPASVGFLPARREVRNAVFIGSQALLIYDRASVDLLDCSQPRQPRFAGRWTIEDWMEPYVPLRGPFLRFRDVFLVLSGGEPGFRVMRLRRNTLNQAKLAELRRRRAGAPHSFPAAR